MNDFDIIVNPSDIEDWKSCVDQSYATNDWRLSYNDYPTYLKIFGPEAFQLLIAKQRETGKVIGFVLFTVYESINGSPRIAQLAHYYVKPEYRKQGIGKTLFERAIAKEQRLGTNITINAAHHMSPKYALRYGFDKFPEWQMLVIRIATVDIALEAFAISPNIIEWFQVDMEKILDYDREIFCGVDRRNYLFHYLRRSDICTRISIDPKTNAIAGMCSIKRIVGDRLLMCPLYANNPKTAEALLRATLEAVDDLHSHPQLIFYTPSCNHASIDIISRLSQGKNRQNIMQNQFTKEVMNVPMGRVYASNAYGLTFI